VLAFGLRPAHEAAPPRLHASTGHAGAIRSRPDQVWLSTVTGSVEIIANLSESRYGQNSPLSVGGGDNSPAFSRGPVGRLLKCAPEAGPSEDHLYGTATVTA
jgi:hypothetical protein